MKYLVTLLALFAATVSLAADGRQPNIVLIVSDYMGYRDTGPYGATDIRTPALDRLAAEGTRMTSFYAASPVCGPARAALYSGQYPARIGFETNIRSEADGLDSSIPTLPQWLGAAGYRTALFGKWHLGYAPRSTPNAHGFDRFVGHHQWTISYYDHRTEQGEPGLFENDRILEREGYLTDLLTDEAIDFVRADGEAPFFITLAYNAALPPYQPPGLPPSKWQDGWDVNSATRADYVGMVEAMDAGVGRLLEALDNNGKAENTLVIYTYDHGGRHLVDSSPLFHGFAHLWEGGIRVPLIMRYPGHVPVGESSDVPGIAMDLTATLLNAAGLADAAAGIDGIDLLPVLNGAAVPGGRSLYWQADLYEFGPQRAIRDGRWKYIEDGNTQFLFDLDQDPGERQNLFHAYPDLVTRLRQQLTEWQEEI
jgi:arylsulfatase A-like enzyme